MAIPHITPEEAHKLLGNGYRYLDVRTEAEFAAGHPAGAVNVPVVFPDPATQQMVLNPEFLRVVRAHFSDQANLVVGCQSGVRSQRAAELLAQAGYSAVVNMRGGFGGARDATGRVIAPGWSQCGLPLCAACDSEHSYEGLRSRAI